MPPDNMRLTSNTLLTGAIDFAELADLHAASRKASEVNQLLLTFILGRSLELALKSVLRHDGATERKLRAFGHDLEELYRAVLAAYPSNRMRLSRSRPQVLRLLRVYYTGKFLEYRQVGVYRLPSPYALRGMVKEAICFGLDHIRGPGACLRHQQRLPRGVSISPEAHYGNSSRRRTIQAQVRQFERIMRAAASPPL